MTIQHFDICTNELLKSISDGIDLRNSAAEYIIACENIDVPSGILYKSLKVTAEEILLKESEKDKREKDALSQDSVKRYSPGEGYTLATHHTHGEPTNHVWQNGLQTTEERNNRFAVWPRYKPTDALTPHREHHFPFHEANHPLRRQHAGTGMPHFVDMLKQHVFDGHIEEEKEFEKSLLKHLPAKHPFIAGYQSPFDKTKNTKLAGNVNSAMTINRHQDDFYNRDYHRWKKENGELYDNMLKDGIPAFEAEQTMRHAHFNDRAEDWVSNEHVQTGSDYMKDAEYHPKNLGHASYMYGLEWFSPEERTAIQKHIEDKGLDEHDEIKLPNGEKIPSARLIYNNLMRMTPEMSWAIREQGHAGRNAHYRQENNETDFHQTGTQRFHQQALGTIAHTPMPELGDRSFADYILEEIDNQHEGNRQMKNQQALKWLPRLDIGKNPMKEMDWDDLRDASNKHVGAKSGKGINKVRMTKDDLLYLAGYDPNTRQLIKKHPIHGKLDGPLIDADMVDYLEHVAKSQGSLHSNIKDFRNTRAFFTAAHGPHPDEEKSPIWKTSNDGTHTYGPGKFWNKKFQNIGGAGLPLSTYLEALHATTVDEDGVSHLMDLSEDATEYIHPNQKNRSVALHFMPEKQQAIGHYDKSIKKFIYHSDPMQLQSLLSPVNVSTQRMGNSGRLSEGFTDKNNFTEHKSSLSPQYEYDFRSLTKDEMKKHGSHNQQNQSHITNIPNRVNRPTTAFGANPSDSNLHRSAQNSTWLNILTGRTNHPNHPVPKSLVKFKDYMRGDSGVGNESSQDDFVDLMGWGRKLPSYNNMKNLFLENPQNRNTVRTVSMVSKILNTTSPKTILDYLEGDDHHELKSMLGQSQFSELNTEEMQTTFKDIIQNLHTENKEAKQTQKNKTQSKFGVHDAISRMLQFGGALPSFEKEQGLNEYLDNLYAQMNDTDNPQDKQSLVGEISKYEQELAILQNKSQKKVLGTSSNHWTKAANQMHDIGKSHRMLMAEVARDKIIPAMTEVQPDAFNPSNPQQFIDNTMRAYRDAQRYIMSVPHNVHGLTATNYATGTQLKETKSKNPFHVNIGKHLSKYGKVIDGNMGVDEVLNMLNIEKTPVAKEHARQLIQQSIKNNTPLMASTVKDILTHDNIKDIDGTPTDVLRPNEELSNKPEDELSSDEKFYRSLHENGYHGALNDAQKLYDKSGWKGSIAHSLPRRVMSLLHGQQNNHTMLAAGIGAIRNDVHGMKNFTSGKGKNKTTAQTKNYLDTIVHFNPDALDDEEGVFTPQISTIKTAGLVHNTPVGAANPNNHSIMDTADSGAWHGGHECSPNVGCEFDANGNIEAGTKPGQGLYYSVPEELLDVIHGKDLREQVWNNAPPPQYPLPPFYDMNYGTYTSPSENLNTIAMSEMTNLISSLLDPDVLLTKSDDASWSPPIRPMHRIFDMKDIEHLKGFSGSWVVSKWYDGQRIIIVRNDDEVIAYDENGKKKGLRKTTKEALEKINEKNYTIDAILGEEELNVIDILNYDDNNISDMQLYERLKILRSQFDSHENVIIPGPHDTRMTDDEGLEGSVNSLKEDHDNILLRDNKSTYMKGERRHPKWLIYRDTKDFNFIVLDRRGKGPYTYQLGAGPINNGEELGNRAMEYKGNYYMDIGTAHNQQKTFKIGDIVRASVTGISKKNRKERVIYNVQFKEIEGEGEGEGAASAESLDLMTKSHSPILIPHDIEVNDTHIQIIMKDIDIVNYSYEQLNDAWVIHSPTSAIGSLKKTDYPVVLAESLLPFWSSVAPLMIKGYLRKETEMKIPDKPSKERTERESAGIIEEDDENNILKPENKKKALELIVRALDAIAKEKMTWTGPKGLGIDVGTPQESPRGPTKLRDEATLPDFDGEKKDTGESKRPVKEPLNHIKLQTDEGENISIDYDNGQPIVSHSQS